VAQAGHEGFELVGLCEVWCLFAAALVVSRCSLAKLLLIWLDRSGEGDLRFDFALLSLLHPTPRLL